MIQITKTKGNNMYFHYSWLNIENQVDNLILQIKQAKLNPDMIVGVVRGGLIPATLISYKLDIPVCSLQWNCRDLNQTRDYDQLKEIMLKSKTGIIIVDDILDSGTTLREIDFYASMFARDNSETWSTVNYAVCIKRTDTNSPVPNLMVGEDLDNFEWVFFPW